jgi:hypothetical protein
MGLTYVAVGIFLAFFAGVSCGRRWAEQSAILRSDCSSAHYMLGRFYYIVPEWKYVQMSVKAARAEGEVDQE